MLLQRAWLRSSRCRSSCVCTPQRAVLRGSPQHSSAGLVGAAGVWLAADDIRMLADAGAAVATPGQHLRLGCGIAPLRGAARPRRDGRARHRRLRLRRQPEPSEALRIASVVSTIRFPRMRPAAGSTPAPCGISPPRQRARPRAGGGPRAVAADARPDLVWCAADSVFLQPLADPLNALVYSETGAGVETVLVDGRVSSRAAASPWWTRRASTPAPRRPPSGSTAPPRSARGWPGPRAVRARRAAPPSHALPFDRTPRPREVIRLDGGSRRPTAPRRVTSCGPSRTSRSRRENEFVTLGGPSGCGKSTLLSSCRLTRPRWRDRVRDTAVREPFPTSASCSSSPCSCPALVLDNVLLLRRDARAAAAQYRKQAADCSS